MGRMGVGVTMMVTGMRVLVVSLVVSMGDNGRSVVALVGQIVANLVAMVADSHADLTASLDDVLSGAAVVDEDG